MSSVILFSIMFIFCSNFLSNCMPSYFYSLSLSKIIFLILPSISIKALSTSFAKCLNSSLEDYPAPAPWNVVLNWTELNLSSSYYILSSSYSSFCDFLWPTLLSLLSIDPYYCPAVPTVCSCLPLIGLKLPLLLF